MGEIFQNQSTSTAADFWEIRTSEDSEGYKISVDISVSSGTHSPSLTGDSGENIFLLREGDSEGPIISTTPVQLTEIIGENTYGLGLYFKAPSEDSVPSAESLSLTIYAEWELHQFEVTLDDLYGSGVSETVTATYGSPMPPATKPTRTGYIFEGYFDQTGGAGKKYYNADMTSASAWDKTSAATLYAHWTFWTSATFEVELFNLTNAGTQENKMEAEVDFIQIVFSHPIIPWTVHPDLVAGGSVFFGGYGELSVTGTWDDPRDWILHGSLAPNIGTTRVVGSPSVVTSGGDPYVSQIYLSPDAETLKLYLKNSSNSFLSATETQYIEFTPSGVIQRQNDYAPVDTSPRRTLSGQTHF